MPTANSFLNGKTFKSVIDLTLLTAGEKGSLPKRIKVLPCGEWMTQPYGPMKVDNNICNQIVANFNADIRKAVPIDVDHDGGRAAGWINKLEAVADDGVYSVDTDWTKYGKGLLKNKEYRLFSPEWSFDYVDPEHSSHHGAVLVAGSLTNRPLFKELPLLVASDGSGKKVEDFTKSNTIVLLLNSEGNKIMHNIEEILKKAVADRSAEEVEFLKTAELSEEQKAQVEVENKPAETEEQKAARELAEKEAADKAEADKVEADRIEAEKVKAEADKVEADRVEAERVANEGKTVTITASELEGMKKQIADFTASERKNTIEKEVTTLVANENGGKILLKAKEGVVNFLITCSDSQKVAFMALMKDMPEIKVAGQTSVTVNENMTAQEQLQALAAEEVKKDSKISASDALQKVIKANPTLANKYNEELKSSK